MQILNLSIVKSLEPKINRGQKISRNYPFKRRGDSTPLFNYAAILLKNVYDFWIKQNHRDSSSSWKSCVRSSFRQKHGCGPHSFYADPEADPETWF